MPLHFLLNLTFNPKFSAIEVFKKPGKKQCIFGGQRIVKNITPFFVYHATSTLGKKSHIRATPNPSSGADSITDIFVSAGVKKGAFFFLPKRKEIKIMILSYDHCNL